ncbi:hypothetical protein ACLBWT_18535 [Paenibacillus sp. D51F]
MNAQMMDSLFVESYMMMNMEISFAGVRSWFEMTELPISDTELFRALLFPEQISPDFQSEFTRMVVYRHEDMFFQASRSHHLIGTHDPIRDSSDPIHQLLLHLLNVRTLRGSENALIDLGVALHKDMGRDQPRYLTLHAYFRQ